MILKTDLCQLMTISGYLRSGMPHRVVTCEASAKKLPTGQRFLVMAGTEEIREKLISMRFTPEHMEFLHSVPALREAMTPTFEEWLSNFRFTGSMWAMAEGEIVFPGEPLVRITAPLPEAQLVETIVLSILNHDIGIASKAARMVLVACGKPLVELGARLVHHEAAARGARAAYLAGFHSTSNVEAGRRFDIPLHGSMAHMWSMMGEDKIDALGKWSKLWTNSSVILDAYDAETAAGVGVLRGVRLIHVNSGDLAAEAKIIRHTLDAYGSCAKIMVSGDLDEHAIHGLVLGGAPIDMFGIEAQLGNASPRIMYRVVYDDTNQRPLMDAAMPGRKQVFLDQREGGWTHLVALDGALRETEFLTPLLDPHIDNGLITSEGISLETSRRYCNAALTSLSALPVGYDLSSMSEPSIDVPVRAHDSLTEMYMRARRATEGEE